MLYHLNISYNIVHTYIVIRSFTYTCIMVYRFVLRVVFIVLKFIQFPHIFYILLQLK